jgi:broad specificity phosphatase PhoE
VRHAHAEWSTDDARPLSRAGQRAAEKVAARLIAAPIRAIYSSPSRRAIDTVAPLAIRLGLEPVIVPELRERELPVVAASEFERTVREAWQTPERALQGGESNVAAQARGVPVIRDVLARHRGDEVVVSTHGNLLALILNAFDASVGFDFWKGLSFPDVYQADFDERGFVAASRVWGD